MNADRAFAGSKNEVTPNDNDPAEQEADGADYDAELAKDRLNNDLKLKYRFESIFAKYSRDFSGIGDEIDLATGEVLVNNGHLLHIQNYKEVGRKRRRLAPSDASHERSPKEEARNSDTSGTDSAQDYTDEGCSEDDEDAQSGSDVGYIVEHAGSDAGYASSIAFNDDVSQAEQPCPPSPATADVWQDVPPLPGDIGYVPSSVSANRPTFSAGAFEELQKTIGNHITQFLDDTQVAAGGPPLLLPQAELAGHSEFPAQVTINLDRNSINFGKPVFTYGSRTVMKVQALNRNVDGGSAMDQKLTSASARVKTPSEIAAAVAKRIREAGLPKQYDLSQFSTSQVATTSPLPTLQNTTVAQSPDSKFERENPANRDAMVGYGKSLIMETLVSEVPSEQHRKEPPEYPRVVSDVQITTSRSVEDPSPICSSGAAASAYKANTGRARSNLPKVAALTDEDDELLIELKERRKMKWHEIHQLFFSDRTLFSLQSYYYTFLKPDNCKQLTEDDDSLLLELKDVQNLPWEEIRARFFPEYRVSQLQYRYYTKLSTPTCKAGWTSEEDSLLLESKEVKCMFWPDIRKQYFPTRTVGAIQYRYYSHLRQADWREKLVKLVEDEAAQKETSNSDAVPKSRSLDVQAQTDVEAGRSFTNEKQHNSAEFMRSCQRRLAASSEKLTASKLMAGKSSTKRQRRQRRETSIHGDGLIKGTVQGEGAAHSHPSQPRTTNHKSDIATSRLGDIQQAGGPLYSSVSPATDQAFMHNVVLKPRIMQRSVQRQMNDALARYQDYMSSGKEISESILPTQIIDVAREATLSERSPMALRIDARTASQTSQALTKLRVMQEPHRKSDTGTQRDLHNVSHSDGEMRSTKDLASNNADLAAFSSVQIQQQQRSVSADAPDQHLGQLAPSVYDAPSVMDSDGASRLDHNDNDGHSHTADMRIIQTCPVEGQREALNPKNLHTPNASGQEVTIPRDRASGNGASAHRRSVESMVPQLSPFSKAVRSAPLVRRGSKLKQKSQSRKSPEILDSDRSYAGSGVGESGSSDAEDGCIAENRGIKVAPSAELSQVIRPVKHGGSASSNPLLQKRSTNTKVTSSRVVSSKTLYPRTVLTPTKGKAKDSFLSGSRKMSALPASRPLRIADSEGSADELAL